MKERFTVNCGKIQQRGVIHFKNAYVPLSLVLSNLYSRLELGKYLISGLHLAIERIWGLAGQLGWE